MKHLAHLVSPRRLSASFWQRVGLDSLLALGGVAVVTALIATTHLYTHVPTFSLTYLLVVLALASFRGLYAAILTALLAFFAYLYFLVPPLYTFLIPTVDDLFTLVIFLVTAIITGQLASSLRQSATQARSRAQELRVLYEQAQELAALQERQRLARELHDSVSQVLYSIGLGAYTACEALENGEEEQTASSLEYIIGLADSGMAEMRALIFELRPESLANEGLVTALSKQVAVLRTCHKLQVEMDLGPEPELSLEQKYNLYRITQEALHNIVRHARASSVSLRLCSQPDQITLEIHDDGRGFDPHGSFPGHLGIHSMRERAEKIGGSLQLTSSADRGTSLDIRVPADKK